MRGARGQTLLEYALLIAAAVAGWAGMSLYLRYAMQGALNQTRVTLAGQASPMRPPDGSPVYYRWDYTDDEKEVSSGKVLVKQVTTGLGPTNRAVLNRIIDTHFRQGSATTLDQP